MLELVKSQIQRHEDDMAVHSSDLASLRAQITTMTSEVDLDSKVREAACAQREDPG